jgi:hypothetical protein
MRTKKWAMVVGFVVLVVCIVVVCILFVCPRSNKIDSEYRCGLYQKNSTTAVPVTITIQGEFSDNGNDSNVFCGSIYLTDENEKTSGGVLEEIPFTKVSEEYISGDLFYYDDKANKYQSLGQLFWSVSKKRFLIIDEDEYICYPSDNYQDLLDQINALQLEFEEEQ